MAPRLVDLRPGTYSLTFSLEGFSSVKRDGIELSADFTMTLNTELKVGALEETLTVSGSAPVVDVQSTTKSQVLNREALDRVLVREDQQLAAAEQVDIFLPQIDDVRRGIGITREDDRRVYALAKARNGMWRRLDIDMQLGVGLAQLAQHWQ